jgi:hypothetical protein
MINGAIKINKTLHTYPFVKFNFICAIKYCKIIDYTFYEKILEVLMVIDLVNFTINLLIHCLTLADNLFIKN